MAFTGSTALYTKQLEGNNLIAEQREQGTQRPGECAFTGEPDHGLGKADFQSDARQQFGENVRSWSSGHALAHIAIRSARGLLLLNVSNIHSLRPRESVRRLGGITFGVKRCTLRRSGDFLLAVGLAFGNIRREHDHAARRAGGIYGAMFDPCLVKRISEHDLQLTQCRRDVACGDLFDTNFV